MAQITTEQNDILTEYSCEVNTLRGVDGYIAEVRHKHTGKVILIEKDQDEQLAVDRVIAGLLGVDKPMSAAEMVVDYARLQKENEALRAAGATLPPSASMDPEHPANLAIHPPPDPAVAEAAAEANALAGPGPDMSQAEIPPMPDYSAISNAELSSMLATRGLELPGDRRSRSFKEKAIELLQKSDLEATPAPAAY